MTELKDTEAGEDLEEIIKEAKRAESKYGDLIETDDE